MNLVRTRTGTSASFPKPGRIAIPRAEGLFLACAVLAWGVVLGKIYFAPAYVPDEVWFSQTAEGFAEAMRQEGFAGRAFGQENALGYGAAYWNGYAAISRVADPLPVVRGFAFAAAMAVPILLVGYARYRGSRFGFSAVLLWMTTPMAWWTGKLSGPEPFSVVLGFAGALLAATGGSWRRTALSAVVLGFAIGIKTNAVGLVAFAAILGAARAEARGRFALALAGGLAAGFVSATPFVLMHPEIYLRNLTNQTQQTPIRLERLSDLLFQNGWQWDAVYNGGLFRFGVAAVPTLLLIGWGVLMRVSGRAWLAGLATFGVEAILFLSNARFFGWYWFPILPLTCLVFCEGRATLGRRGGVAAGLAVVLIAANAAIQYPAIRDQWRFARQAAAGVKHRKEIETQIDRAIGAFPERPIAVLDYTPFEPALTISGVRAVRKRAEAVHLIAHLQHSTGRSAPIALVACSAYATCYPSDLFLPRTPDRPLGYDAVEPIPEFGAVYLYHADPVDW